RSATGRLIMICGLIGISVWVCCACVKEREALAASLAAPVAASSTRRASAAGFDILRGFDRSGSTFGAVASPEIPASAGRVASGRAAAQTGDLLFALALDPAAFEAAELLLLGAGDRIVQLRHLVRVQDFELRQPCLGHPSGLGDGRL